MGSPKEDQPLLGVGNHVNGKGLPNRDRRRMSAFRLVAVLAVAVGALIIVVMGYYSAARGSVVDHGDASRGAGGPYQDTVATSASAAPGASSSSSKSAVMYRPYCLTHSKSTARILQTSMGQPSQQWSRIPCYSQTAAGRLWASRKSSNPYLNQFGAPDAALNVSFKESPFDDRSNPILGFGAAFTDATALNYATLSEQGKKTFLELFFGKSGLGYTLARVPINSCDFSIKSYSFDDVDGDFDLEYFDNDVAHDRDLGVPDMVKAAAKLLGESWSIDNQDNDGTVVLDGQLKVHASPWSPPAWMKAPRPSDKPDAVHAANMTGSHYGSCLREGTGPESQYAAAWAKYFSKFISAYANLGVVFWGVTVQNEPEFAAPWEACSYTPQTEADFVAYHLGPQLKKDHPDVKILIFDHNKDHVINWVSLIANKTHPASQYINGTAIHWYAGGLDRLLDGAVGAPNMHKLQTTLQSLDISNNHIVLGSEACHCPSTGYAGGDIEIYWARAERYAHTILSDLAAGSQGWVEWNFMLDSIGGPNHLGNLCDAPVLAVPHRAINGSNIPPTMEWEHSAGKFGPSIGDGRTRAELNALGFPAKHLDDGLAVQPMYYYMGHISRYVRPGSKAVHGIVAESKPTEEGKVFRAFRPPGQVVPGGGMNDLARIGVELTLWPCEGSTRQQFFFNEESQIQVFGHDWLGQPTTSCVGGKNSEDFGGVALTACKKHKFGTFDVQPSSVTPGAQQIVLTNRSGTTAEPTCLAVRKLGNDGGAHGPRGGAQVVLSNCMTTESDWIVDEALGEIRSAVFGDSGEVCMTTGWPFLQIVAFDTPKGASDTTVVVLNEAKESANYVMYNDNTPVLSGSIPPRSIQTVLIDS